MCQSHHVTLGANPRATRFQGLRLLMQSNFFLSKVHSCVFQGLGSFGNSSAVLYNCVTLHFTLSHYPSHLSCPWSLLPLEWRVQIRSSRLSEIKFILAAVGGRGAVFHTHVYFLLSSKLMPQWDQVIRIVLQSSFL